MFTKHTTTLLTPVNGKMAIGQRCISLWDIVGLKS